MKRSVRAVVWGLCLILLLSVFCCSISAADTEDHYQRRRNELDALWSRYRTKELALGTECPVATLLWNQYCTPLAHLSREESENAELVDLIYYKACAAAPLAWIYYSHADAAKNPDIALVYEKQLSLINGQTAEDPIDERNAFFLGDGESAPRVYECYTALLNGIYSHRLEQLARSDDSPATSALLSDAILRLNDPAAPSDPLNPTPSFTAPEHEDAANYAAFVAYVQSRVTCQRNRDATARQLLSVYGILYPDASLSSLEELAARDDAVRSFAEALPSDTTVVQMNARLSETVTALLAQRAQTEGSYTRTYLSHTLTEQVKACILNASGSTPSPLLASVAELCFGDGYRLELAKAQGKDALWASANALGGSSSDKQSILEALIAEYTEGYDSLFDTCASLDELAVQRSRANDRLLWFTSYLTALADVRDALEKYDSPFLSESEKSAMLAKVDTQYRDTDRLIRDGLSDGERAPLPAGEDALAALVRDAELLSFTQKHEIVTALPAVITRAHKSALAEALTDAQALSPAVKESADVISLLLRLAQAYKTAVSDELDFLLSPSSNDTDAHIALNERVRASLQALKDSLGALSERNDNDDWVLSELVTRAEALSHKAKQLGTVLGRYLALLNDADDDYTAQMQTVCDDAAARILADTEGRETAIAAEAEERLLRLHALEQIKDACAGHENVEGIADILANAESVLLPDSAEPPADLDVYREDALFQIENCLLADQMRQQLDQIKSTVNGMEHLSDEERARYVTRADALSDYLSAVRSATHKTDDSAAVAEARTSFSEALSHLQYAISAFDNAHRAYREKLTQIDAMSKPTAEQKSAWKAEATEAYGRFSNTLAEVLSDEDVDAAASVLRDTLDRILSTATAENLRLTKEEAVISLTAAATALSQTIDSLSYIDTATRQALLLRVTALLNDAVSEIESCEDTAAVAQIKTDGERGFAQIDRDAAEEERVDCLNRLKNDLTAVHGDPSEYSSEQLVKIWEIIGEYQAILDADGTISEYLAHYEEGVQRIRAIPTLAQEARTDCAQRLTLAYEALMQRKNCYSADNLSALIECYTEAHKEILCADRYQRAAEIPALRAVADDAVKRLRSIPLDYVLTESDSEYEGRIAAAGRIPSDITLSISPSLLPSETLRASIRQAAKEKRVLLSDGSAADRTLLRLLRGCLLTASASFSLENAELTDGEQYRVSLRLPDGYALSHLLGIVCLREDGSVEFLEVDADGRTLSFTTTHFSEYYIVSAKVTNLYPLLFALLALIAAEVIALIVLYARRRRRERGSATLCSLLPLGLAMRYKPTGGLALAWLLGITALGLGVWIAALLLAERKSSVASNAREEAEEKQAAPVMAAAAQASSREPLPDDAPSSEPLLEPIVEISAEDADALMSDEAAREHLRTEDTFRDHERYRGSKRAQINLDIISAHFSEGDVVTLNSLKEKKLVPSNVGFVKILARGTIDKPLTVLAQDFSAAALKMLLLTGGTPIRTHASPERGGPQRKR